MSARVRLATISDSALLARLHRQCFDDAWDESAFRQLLERPGTFALVIGEAETYSQAFVLIQVAADQAEILSLGTEPSSRCKGLGRTLAEAGAAEAFRLGAGEIFLEVAEDNNAALALYRRAGFAVCGRRAGYYRRRQAAPADAVILRASLPL